MTKVILVTGASSGFGKLTAMKLIQRGHIVYGAARRLNEMDDLVAEGGYSMKMDVTKPADVKSGVARIVKEQGQIDVLVNNAGFGAYDFVETADLKKMKAMFDVNFWGLVNASQQVLPAMRKKGVGRIVNISSLAGKISTPTMGFYSASKHAVEAISDATRQEVARYGIKVAIIEPGIFKTEFEEVMSDQFYALETPADYQQQLSGIQKFFNKSFRRAPKPSPVVKAIAHAVESKRPKTRYLVGTDALSAGTARKLLSDTAFDRLIIGQMRI